MTAAVQAGTFIVPASHPSLPGHFPGHPIAPGVLLLDEAAALIMAGSPGRRVVGFPNVRFLRPVLPGDMVSVEHEGGAFTCLVAGEPVIRGVITLAPS